MEQAKSLASKQTEIRTLPERCEPIGTENKKAPYTPPQVEVTRVELEAPVAASVGASGGSNPAVNNPCPNGFRLPTQAELAALVAAAGINNHLSAASSKLKFPIAGWRHPSNGGLNNISQHGVFWSSTISGTKAIFAGFYSSGAFTYGSEVQCYGMAVRCIKN